MHIWSCISQFYQFYLEELRLQLQAHNNTSRHISLSVVFLIDPAESVMCHGEASAECKCRIHWEKCAFFSKWSDSLGLARCTTFPSTGSFTFALRHHSTDRTQWARTSMCTGAAAYGMKCVKQLHQMSQETKAISWKWLRSTQSCRLNGWFSVGGMCHFNQ